MIFSWFKIQWKKKHRTKWTIWRLFIFTWLAVVDGDFFFFAKLKQRACAFSTLFLTLVAISFFFPFYCFSINAIVWIVSMNRTIYFACKLQTIVYKHRGKICEYSWFFFNDNIYFFFLCFLTKNLFAVVVQSSSFKFEYLLHCKQITDYFHSQNCIYQLNIR